MAREEPILLDARVTEALAGAQYRVRAEGGQEILAHLAGKMRRFARQISPGDEVRVEVSPYDLEKGRIVSWQGG